MRCPTTLCDRVGLTVERCHYPTGCSRWNPIEHHQFSQISLSWAGRPLRTMDTLLAYLPGTTTATGLTVRAVRLDDHCPQDQKVSKAAMQCLNLEHHAVCPRWNYCIRPHPLPSTAAASPRHQPRNLLLDKPVSGNEKWALTPQAGSG
jgi:hypothetical protein